jgi:hypothetical protein
VEIVAVNIFPIRDEDLKPAEAWKANLPNNKPWVPAPFLPPQKLEDPVHVGFILRYVFDGIDQYGVLYPCGCPHVTGVLGNQGVGLFERFGEAFAYLVKSHAKGWHKCIGAESVQDIMKLLESISNHGES